MRTRLTPVAVLAVLATGCTVDTSDLRGWQDGGTDLDGRPDGTNPTDGQPDDTLTPPPDALSDWYPTDASLCEPIQQLGCPSGQSCYVMNPEHTVCYPNSGTGLDGATCTGSADCNGAAGFACYTPDAVCRRYCAVADPQCPAPQVCWHIWATYGFCW